MWDLYYKESWGPKNWWFWTEVLEQTLERQLDFMELQPVNPKGHQSWVFFGRTDVEAETPTLWPPNVKNLLIGKYPDAGKDWRPEEKGMTEDEKFGWHHWLNGKEFEQAPGDSERQGSLTCCRPWVTMSQTWLSNWKTKNFITCYKCATLVEVVTNGEWCSCFGTDSIWGISVASQFLAQSLSHVHHQLPEFRQTHVHRVSDAIQPSHPLPSPSPPAPNPSPHQSLFQWVSSSHEVAKVLEFQL